MSGFRRIVAIACGAAVLTSAGAMAQEPGEDIQVVYHELQEGETVGSVALEYEVNVVDLKQWNGLESIYDVAPSDELEVHLDREDENSSGPQPVVHVVSSGDTFEAIARRYGVRISQLRQWNSNVDPRRLQIGERLRLHVPGSDGDPVSWGRANNGRLYNGVGMESGPGLEVRNQSRSYGTQRTIDFLKAAGADVQARWPDAPELVVGSLSTPRGGPMRPHRSHQSGRDADLSYYHRGNVALSDFLIMTPERFDAVKNWHFFKILIETGEVQFIFVDYELQRVLYEYALSIGYTESDLEEILQYPRSRHAAVGVIRHARGHANHFHIRFTCGDRDQNCQ